MIERSRAHGSRFRGSCFRCAGAVLLIACGGWGSLHGDETFYIQTGSSWRYLRGLAEASEPDPAAWRQPAFDDASWARGPAPFGYGDPPYGTDLSKLAPPMRNNYTSLFLRREFEVSEAGAIAALEANVNFDDGFIAWLNGVEVLRINVAGQPGDAVLFSGVASGNREPGRFQNAEILDARARLVSGTNVLAVQVFNSAKDNNDLKFDLELLDPAGPDLSPPAAALVVPAGGSRVRRLSAIDVSFSEEVTGVDAADLLINGVPAAFASGTGAGPYRFNFAAPPAGRVDAAWASGHGILDLSPHPNAFAGGTFAYTLDPDSPPAQLVIGELLAQAGGLKDEDGQESDWIEIQNRGAEPVNLAGWALTDDREEPGQWVFPDLTLGPQELLVVFASGKDRRPSRGGTLHTSFQLNADGEYLGLFTPELPREPISELAPRFPPQRAGVSYGLDAAGAPGWFDPPTPGAPNEAAAVFRGFAADPVFSPSHGFFEGPIEVEITSRTPEAAIYYTLDGSEPTPEKGKLYTGPLAVAGEPRRAVATLRAIAARDGYLASAPSTATYIFAEHVLTQPANPDGFPRSWGRAPAVDYEMDPEIVNHQLYKEAVLEGLTSIPSISVVASIDDLFGGRGIYSNTESQGAAWERPGSAEMIFPDGREGFQINCGVQIQGGASRLPEKSPKHALRLLFKGDYGPTRLQYPLFPGSPVASFDAVILRAGFNNTWIHWNGGQRSRAQFIHDQWARDTQRAMDGLAGRGIYVHLYLNGLYWGLYNLVERPNAAFAASHLGGEKEDYDALNAGLALDGNLLAWSQLMAAVNGGQVTAERYAIIQEHLDVPALADYMLLNFYGANMDWPGHNWYCIRRREPGAGWKFVSWDAERILEGISDNQLGVSDGNTPAYVHSRLLANPEYRLLFADRAQRHLFAGGALTPESAKARWTEHTAVIEKAVVAESARWGDYRRDVHRWQDPPYELYARESHWKVELNRLLNQYFPQRATTLLGQLRQARLYPAVGAPVFSQRGGVIQPGFALSMSLPAGTTGAIHFTTDGSDPRVAGTGEVSPAAMVYGEPLPVNDLTVVKARVLAGAVWSALEEAVFTTSGESGLLRFSEIMYHPADGAGREFIELENAGSSTVDLSGMHFSAGIEFAFPTRTFLRSGERTVLAADPEAFQERYPAVPVGGRFSGSLDNGGERLTLSAPGGETVVSVEYDDEGLWPIAPDGFDRSLVAVDAEGPMGDPESWRQSAERGGSPGNPDPASRHGGVVVSEVLGSGRPPMEAAIELQNVTGRPISIGGWYLSDERGDEASLKKHRLPEGTVLPAGGRVVFYGSQLDSTAGAFGRFKLDAKGGEVFLSACGRDGELSGYIASAQFGPEEPGISFGRHSTSIGVDFTALASPTFGADKPATPEEFRAGKGAPNAGPRIGPVVINEVHYHPQAGGGEEAEEFVELRNLTGSPVPLHVDFPGIKLARGWRLEGAFNAEGTDDFELPPGAEIPASGYALLVGVEPERFRARHPLPPDVPVYGPFGGGLDNGGERLRLSKPILLPAGEIAHAVVDEVRYNDANPWPAAADGEGPSLERVLAREYGNDPINWEASAPPGGTPGAANSVSPPAENGAPTASFTAAPQSGPAPLVVALDASSSSDPEGAVEAEWDFGDGSTGTGRTVSHTFNRPGVYTVVLRAIDGQGAWSEARIAIIAEETLKGGGQLPGDLNQDGRQTISDAIVLMLHLFSGSTIALPCEGALEAEGNRTLADLNGDAAVNLSDPIHYLHYLFLDGVPPALGIDCARIAGCPDSCTP